MRFTLLVSLSLAFGNRVAASCQGDNCLRALSASPASAAAFCATYTAQILTVATAFPTFLVNCQASSSKISSACSCFAPSSISTTSTSSTTSTISTTLTTSSPSSSATCASPATITVTAPAVTSYLNVTIVETDITTDTETSSVTVDVSLSFTVTSDFTAALSTEYFTSTEVISDIISVTSTITSVSTVTLSAPTITQTVTATEVPNAIVNGGFESGVLSPWTLGDDGNVLPLGQTPTPTSTELIGSDFVHSGNFSLTILPGISTDNYAQYQNFALSQTFTILPGLSYNLTFWALSEDPYGCAFYSLLAGYYIASHEFTIYSSQGWQQFSRAYAGGTATDIELQLLDSDCSGRLWLDDFVFTPTLCQV